MDLTNMLSSCEITLGGHVLKQDYVLEERMRLELALHRLELEEAKQKEAKQKRAPKRRRDRR